MCNLSSRPKFQPILLHGPRINPSLYPKRGGGYDKDFMQFSLPKMCRRRGRPLMSEDDCCYKNFKKERRSYPSCHWPISRAGIPRKLFERILKEALPHHLHPDNILDLSSHGFHSSSLCIINMPTLGKSLIRAYGDNHISRCWSPFSL